MMTDNAGMDVRSGSAVGAVEDGRCLPAQEKRGVLSKSTYLNTFWFLPVLFFSCCPFKPSKGPRPPLRLCC